jgi:hypothetical protein
MRVLNLWVRKLHIYAGLLNITALMVFGIAGLVVTADAPDIFHAGSKPVADLQAFSIPGTASDKEAGRLIQQALHPADAGPPVIHRDAEHHLVTDFYSVNGLIRATVLEQTNQLRVETFRNSIWRFLDNAHATTISEQAAGNAIRLWAWYIEFSIWSLLFMASSGVWLGLSARWRFRWTQISLAAGCVAFVAFYFLER